MSEADHEMTTMASELWLLMLAAVLGRGSIGVCAFESVCRSPCLFYSLGFFGAWVLQTFLWFSAVDITMENFICGMKFAIRDGYDQNMKLVLVCISLLTSPTCSCLLMYVFFW